MGLLAVFLIGYLMIVFEERIHINKTASSLITGVLCWVLYALGEPQIMGNEAVTEQLLHHMAEISEILFFILAAMTIVEQIDAHKGFEIITEKITTRSTRKLLWIVGILAFFLSAALDNLVTAVVMASMLRKLVCEKHVRLMLVCVVVVACNAGGAWSPIGDVTTTMLWIGGQVSAPNILKALFLPSLVSLLIPMVMIHWRLGGVFTSPTERQLAEPDGLPVPVNTRVIVFCIGLGGLLFVPLFKAFTGLPPFMGMMLVLGLVWAISELLHRNESQESRNFFSPINALSRTDVPSVLFFLGILLAVAALDAGGYLLVASKGLGAIFPNEDWVMYFIGLLSALLDNVPIVAAVMGMYPLADYPQDHKIWEFLAYAAGTGGSLLLIGSAAGVAVMGIEQINFNQYFKRMFLPALVGYSAGAAVYLLIYQLLIGL